MNMFDEEAEVPSWLKEENDSKSTSKEQTPLLGGKADHRTIRTLPKTSSSGGSNYDVEEDYGGTSYYKDYKSPTPYPSSAPPPPPPPSSTPKKKDTSQELDTSWADEPTSNDNDNDEEDDSSSEEEGTDEEEEPFGSGGGGLDAELDEEQRQQQQHWTEELEKNKRSSSSSHTYPPRRGICHSIFVAIQVIGVMANLSMIATQVVPIFMNDIKEDNLQVVVRVYLAIFSFIFLLAELEVPCLKSQSLSNWVSRGFLYTFLGIVTLEQHSAMITQSKKATGEGKDIMHIGFITFDVEWTLFFIEITSWWIIGLGCVYFLFGIFCMKRVRNRLREKYQKQWKEYKQKNDAQQTSIVV